MKDFFPLVFTILNLIIFGYVLFGLYHVGQIVFSDKILIGQNISATLALVSYIYIGFNLIKNKNNNGIVFSLTLTCFIWSISLALYSRVFVFEMIKQLALPFIMTLYLFFKNKNNMSNKDILSEILLSSVVWISLTILSFENIYNMIISIILLGITYYLIQMLFPLQEEVYQ